MTAPRLAAPALASVLGAIVAACSAPAPVEPRAEPDAPPAEAPAAPPVLAGVDLSQPVTALGTEPFWSVRIRADGIEYDGVDRPLRRGANPGPSLEGQTAVWATDTGDGNALVVTLTPGPCSDGMSDRTYPLTARVEVGAETLNGCAASPAFIETTGEGG